MFPGQANGGFYDHQHRRRRLFKMQSCAARMLWGVEAVAKCRRVVTYGKDIVGIKLTKQTGRAAYAGLQTCRSVWHCPICAEVIAHERQEEVEDVIQAALDAGHQTYLATFTTPHRFAYGQCRPLKEGVAEAMRRMQQGRAWVEWKARTGLRGTIRALEVTHGKNGWHPHFHVAMIFTAGIDAGAEKDWLVERWGSILVKMGLGVISPDAQDFQKCTSPSEAGEYVAKWGPHSELTKAPSKQGRLGNRGPFQILADLADADDDDLYKPGTDAFRDRLIWEEYALAFKGARQIGYSRGLREGYELRDAKTDQEAAEGPEAVPFIWIPRDAWSNVQRAGLQTALLDLCETNDADDVCALLGQGLIDQFGKQHDPIQGLFPAWDRPHKPERQGTVII